MYTEVISTGDQGDEDIFQDIMGKDITGILWRLGQDIHRDILETGASYFPRNCGNWDKIFLKILWRLRYNIFKDIYRDIVATEARYL